MLPLKISPVNALSETELLITSRNVRQPIQSLNLMVVITIGEGHDR